MKISEYNNIHIANHVNTWILYGDGLYITKWYHHKDLSKVLRVYQ